MEIDVNKATVVTKNMKILIREYLTNKSYFTEMNANIMNDRMTPLIDTNLMILLSMSNGARMAVAATGIDVDNPIIIESELRKTLEFFLYVAKL